MKVLSILFILLFSTSTTDTQQSIAGVWDTGVEHTKILIKEVNGKMEGAIFSSYNEKPKNGAKMIKDVQFRNGKWKGKLYAPKKDQWLDATFTRKDNKLKITVYSGWVSKTIEWKKA